MTNQSKNPPQPHHSSSKKMPHELFLMYRKRTGWTQEELAQKIGLSSSRTIRNWEVGQNLPKAERLKQLIELYLSYDVFLPENEKAEVVQLWHSVKDSFDSTTEKFNLYPVFDSGWFETVLRKKEKPDTEPEITSPPEDETNEITNKLIPAAVPVHNLPLQLTSFIGREKEVAEIKDKVLNFPLVTLTGLGGVGKTRLLLQVGAELLRNFPDGVWLVELANVQDYALVTEVVAQVLGVSEQAGKTFLESLSYQLRYKKLMLLLDNCEHVVKGCVELTETLLKYCPGLKILATSREVLGVSGELIWNVPPLDLPGILPSVSPSTLLDYEAVELFVERATINNPKFSITENNAQTVLEICHKLEGIPLAIELASAKIRVLSVEEILVRLNDRFKLLTGGSNLLPRHQTLRALIAWSYDMLDETEQILLQRLSGFMGSWTLESAEAVAGDDEAAGSKVLVPKEAILDLLTQLINKSLVLKIEPDEVGENGTETETRYRFLDTIREYAWEKLQARDEELLTQERHLAYFARLLEEIDQQPGGLENHRWLERTDREYSNIRATLEWVINQPNSVRIATGLNIVRHLRHYWSVRGFFSEGLRLITNLVTEARLFDLTQTVQYAWGFIALGTMHTWLGNFKVSILILEESQALFEDFNEKEGVVMSLLFQGICLTYQNDWQQAKIVLLDTLKLAQASEQNYGLPWVLQQLGYITTYLRQSEEANDYLAQALTLFRRRESERGITYTLPALGNLALSQEDYVTAYQFGLENLTIAQRIGDKWSIIRSLQLLGDCDLLQGKFQSAKAYFRKSVELGREIDNKWSIARNIVGLAATAQRTIEKNSQIDKDTQLEGYLQLGRICGGIAILLAVIGTGSLDEVSLNIYQTTNQKLYQVLGAELYTHTYQAGQELTFEQLWEDVEALLKLWF